MSPSGAADGRPSPSRRQVLRAACVLGLAAGAGACGSALGPAAGAPRPVPRSRPAPVARPGPAVVEWQQKFDAAQSATAADARRLSQSSDSWDFYSLAYEIDAAASMLVATGDPRYADTGLQYAENMMASARPSSSLASSDFKDVYLGWVSHENGSTGEEVPLYESYCWRYVTRLLRAMRDGGQHVDPAYRPRYDAVLGFAESNMFDKWFSRGPDDYIYRERTHMAAHWASIGVDLAALTGDAGRRDRCSEVVGKIDRGLPNYPSSLRQQLRPSPTEPDAYLWSDVWGKGIQSAQDVSHGNAVISYVVEAHTLGSEWTDADMGHFTRTLTAFVLGDGHGQYPERIDGTGSGNGWISDGFVKLGRYDPAVQAVLESYGVQNDQYYAAMAENARRLGGATSR